jgi:NAD(P)H dehydrogenase (quinone)
MAKAVVEGAQQVEGVEVKLARFAETLSDDILAKMGALEAAKQFKDIPVVTHDDFVWADAIIMGSPTRFGSIAPQVSSFLASCGQLWLKGALIGKIGSAFTSTATQHGGQELTLLAGFFPFFLHQGMVIVGLPYAFQGQTTIDAIEGCSPYGASTITGGQGQRQPSTLELDGARFQGNHVATLAVKVNLGAERLASSSSPPPLNSGAVS